MSLWCLSLLTAFSVSLGYAVRQKAALIDRLDTFDTLIPMAYSGIEIARGLVKGEDFSPTYDCLNDPWSKDPAFKEVPLGDGGSCSVSYQISKADTKEMITLYGLTDEQSKINVNTADAETLTRILQSAGSLDEEAAAAAAFCIIDWRDADFGFEHPSYGAEDDYYNHLQQPYACKNAPFEVPDELLLIKGINREIFDKIRLSITSFGTGQVNINTASKEVLTALGLQDRTVDKIISYRYGDDRDERTGDDRVFTDGSAIPAQLNKVTAIDMAEKTALETLISGGKLGTVSTHFMAQSRAVLQKNGAFLDMESVIDRKGKIYYLRTSRAQRPVRK
ncbi:MAG: hypothetical protein AUJ72_05070 [Candidatus Omnitrophica bacterium CG1_02_46_14]|nr:MAG: hypothetical protein AUJ72_05070 [Candidatus Omnitrophica bacterium CG1_02_46_14]